MLTASDGVSRGQIVSQSMGMLMDHPHTLRMGPSCPLDMLGTIQRLVEVTYDL